MVETFTGGALAPSGVSRVWISSAYRAATAFAIAVISAGSVPVTCTFNRTVCGGLDAVTMPASCSGVRSSSSSWITGASTAGVSTTLT